MIAEERSLSLVEPFWRGMGRDELDRAYDNSSAVADSAEYLADWSRRSAELREGGHKFVGLAYGPRERNHVDLLRCGVENAPLLVFIHGGYWQRNSKDIFLAMAEGPLAAGLDVALPGYTLAPEASLAGIVEQMRTAVAYLRQNGPAIGAAKGRLVVSGWSAGGHLAASMMNMAEVDAGLAISGIYDLEPIRRGSLNDKLGLSPADVASLSPIAHLPATSGKLTIAYGTAELPELQRQSEQYAAEWKSANRAADLLPVAGADHFSILEQLARPGGVLAIEAARLAGQA